MEKVGKTKNKFSQLKTALIESFKGRYLLAFVFVVAYVTSVVFTTQGLSLFSANGVGYMNDVEFYLMVVVSTLLGIGLLIFAKRYFNLKINFPLFVVCSVLMVIDIVAVLTFPDAINGEPMGHLWTYNITAIERVRYILAWFVGDLALYCFVGAFPTLFRSHKTVDFWLWVGVGIGFLLILCSFIIEADGWKGLITGTNPYWRAQSITNYQNTFGFAVLWSFCCSLILYGKYRKVPSLIITIFFAVMTIVLQVKTCVGAVGIAAVLSLIWFPIVGWKKRKKQQIALLSVSLGTMALIALIALVDIPGFGGFKASIRAMVTSLFTFSGGTMTGRTFIWHDTFNNMILHPSILLLGTGDGVFEWFVAASAGIAEPSICQGYPVHNGFLFVWGRFGIVGLLVYLFGLGYIFYDVIHAIRVRKEKWMGVVAIAFICYLVHSVGEDDALLDMRLKGIMGLAISWLPLAVSRREWKERNANITLPEPKQIMKRKAAVSDVIKTSCIATLLLLVVIVGLAPMFETAFGECSFNNKYSLSGLTILLLVLPISIGEAFLIYRKNDLTHFWVHIVFTGVILLWGILMMVLKASMIFPIATAIACVLLLLEGGIGLEFKKAKFLDVLPLLIRFFVALISIGVAHALNAYLAVSSITKTLPFIILALYIALSFLGLVLSSTPREWSGSFDILAYRSEALYEKIALSQLDKAEKRMSSLY